MSDQNAYGQPAATPPTAPAGWYPDAAAGGLRYWDGVAWTHGQAPASQPTIPPAPMYPAPGQAVQQVPYGMAPMQAAPQYGAYGAPVVTIAPDGTPVFVGRRVCTPWERFGAYLLDSVLMLCTLYIGWIIWACFTAGEGQTPAKKLLGQRVHTTSNGQPATFATMFFMRGLLGGLIFGASFYILVGFVLMFMPFWDSKNQTVVDKISSTLVLKDRP